MSQRPRASAMLDSLSCPRDANEACGHDGIGEQRTARWIDFNVRPEAERLCKLAPLHE